MSILDLPSEILLEIMVRLPITTILSCRCVCKSLNSLLSDPSSAHLYLQSQPSTITNLILHNKADDKFILMEYDSTLPSNTPTLTPINAKIDDSPITRGVWNRNPLVVGFSNGFVCLRDFLYCNCLYIMNPILGEYVILPKYGCGCDVYAFGYSQAESCYKVLAISSQLGSDERWEARVLTLGSLQVNEDSWRLVGNDIPFTHYGMERNATVNGCIYWVHYKAQGFSSDSGPVDDFIYSFNFDTESVKSIPSPPVSGKFGEKFKGLGVLENRLCLYMIDTETRVYVSIDIWSMKEYGVKESWTKVRIMVSSFPHGIDPFYRRCILPLRLSTEDWEEVKGEILMMCAGTLGCCDSSTGVLTRLCLPDQHVNIDRHCFLAYSFTPSFLSLKHANMGGLKIYNLHPRGTPSSN